MSSQSSLPLLSRRARAYEPNERFIREQSERRLTALTVILGVILLVVGGPHPQRTDDLQLGG